MSGFLCACALVLVLGVGGKEEEFCRPPENGEKSGGGEKEKEKEREREGEREKESSFFQSSARSLCVLPADVSFYTIPDAKGEREHPRTERI